MSYDVSLEVVKKTTVYSGNYTYNCSPMFVRAIGQDGINSLHGQKAKFLVDQLERAVAHISDPDNEPFYKELEPENGWGSHEGATEYLKEILEACRNNPEGVFHVG
ncbi:hypothetical protein [Agrobacterium sp.]|uniref:hypothetical protein n=1 Tax=Agrobacterium sp. TaxID=361 RepID=UPI00289FAB4F|nr:hypothetical protein [Agrobacterium sp.]